MCYWSVLHSFTQLAALVGLHSDLAHPVANDRHILECTGLLDKEEGGVLSGKAPQISVKAWKVLEYVFPPATPYYLNT